MSANILIIGGGGREHALVWKLESSNQVQKIFITPGNAGTSLESKTQNINLNVDNHNEVAEWCRKHEIDLVVVGPEAPLANGITDFLMNEKIKCFGPSKLAARIESSKSFAKSFMKKYHIPTARWESFENLEQARKHIETANYDGLVVKADGLAAGKGVVVARSKDEAIQAAETMIKDKKFGDAGATILIEERLCGEEISVLAFSDGTNVSVFPPAQDFKRLNDDENAPNTGGMGAYCPVGNISQETLNYVKNEIIQKTIFGMKEEGYPFTGILYAGLMLTKDGPKVLEFNCRFGDPETQVLLPLLKSDLYEALLSCVEGNLCDHSPVFHTNRRSVTIVMASKGYPGSYKKGLLISGLNVVKTLPNIKVFHAGTKAADGQIVTSGGRVLAVTGTGTTPDDARFRAYQAVQLIDFEGKFYREDIAANALRFHRAMSYSSSGVDIDEGLSLVEAFKPLATATARVGCEPDLGSFGGIFDMKACNFKDPLLVSGADGVGTKLKVAQACDVHNTVGIDLVAMCVNDVLSQGAEPLFFLDYFACGELQSGVVKQVVTGVAQGCALAGCALLGGETAEMPGMYLQGEYDLAGFAVGAVERANIILGKEKVTPGNAVIGIASSGIHSNGFSLVRKIFEMSGLNFTDTCVFGDSNRTFGEEFLIPTKIYVKAVLPLIKQGKIKACAHITGGGLPDNIPRVLGSETAVRIDASKWEIPPVFCWLAKVGHVAMEEMLRTFNCGVGFMLIVDSNDVTDVLTSLENSKEKAWVIGDVIQRAGGHSQVIIENFDDAMEAGIENISPEAFLSIKRPVKPRMRIGVLISGSGTNLQALIDQSMKANSQAEIRLVISNIAGVKGLERAENAGIKTKVVSHKAFKSRLEFDNTVSRLLEEENIELVCLAGFMRILTGEFVRKWRGKLLNIHPSLLPSFKGINAHQQVLDAGVRISGCTVHFVEEEVDAGGIVIQESVPVLPTDTVEVLQERVKQAEHKAYPRAMELMASGKIRMKQNGKVEWL